MELSERKEKILSAIIEHYIKTGEPVGSKWLQSALDISVSSATIRNEMAELSNLGLLEQPHTSAGRIPTNDGYRYYVDNLMGMRSLDEAVKRQIEAGISTKNASPEAILRHASDFLADMTNCAAISTAPSGENAVIKRIEFVPIGTRTGMVVLLTSTGIIKSKVCRCDVDLNAGIIEKFYNIVQSSFIGTELDEIDTALLQTLVASMGVDALTMIPLVSAVSDLASEAAQTTVVLGGQSNILQYNSHYGSTAYELLDFLRRGEPLSMVLKNSKDDLDVLIGNENKYKQLSKSSVIMAQYSINDKDHGSIGIIGPTRIDYAGLIPSVRYLADLVGKILTKTLNEE
ncbi:MAG: heat-inducible transcription repressor HrcA [Ruminococcus sp.]|nr:heat-inducible transcription repressor HrcA [Candidatus Copronaster equi]